MEGEKDNGHEQEHLVPPSISQPTTNTVEAIDVDTEMHELHDTPIEEPRDNGSRTEPPDESRLQVTSATDSAQASLEHFEEASPHSQVTLKNIPSLAKQEDGAAVASAGDVALEMPDPTSTPLNVHERATTKVEDSPALGISSTSAADIATEKTDAADAADGSEGPSAINPSITKIQSRPMSRAGSVSSNTNGEQLTPASTLTGAPSRVYLKEQVNDWLLEGMRWLVYARPANGLLALGEYLQSADYWRKQLENDKKDPADFQRYWTQFQSWKEKNSEKSEVEYRASLSGDS